MLGQARLQLENFLNNTVFLSALFSWFSAQLIKTIINLLKNRIRSIRDLFSLLFWRTGGMPSSHSALVISICTAIGIRNGIDSDLFILSFALVVMRDAVGVRRASGIQAKTLNELGKKLESKELLDFKPVKEINGHKPIEVIMGAFLGFFIGLAFSIL